METLFIWLQHSLPQHWLSRCTGWLARLQRPRWLKNLVIQRFAAHYGVDLGEAEHSRPEDYRSFNAFFTRALQPGARPLADAGVLSPADGAISQIGEIDGNRLLQAKGQWFSLSDLLAQDSERGALFTGGSFATIYLSPRDYHRVHMPLAGTLSATCYVPGRLFSVNGLTASRVPGLFARNERLICYFDTEAGPMAMILVGAMIVAGIETVWSGQEAPVPRRPQLRHYAASAPAVSLSRGEEMGRFLLGSTVILLFPRGRVSWRSDLGAGSPVRLGEALAEFTSAGNQ
jgi:phosphatidylserine decarboxylase